MTTLVAERVTEKRVMVVEDESIISLDIRNSLKKLGYGIAGAAASGDVALMKIANSRPDLILMDIHLKGKMTGIQVSQQVQSNFQIPVIYLTANADSATFNGAKETSPYGYLLKPFEEKELGMAIEIALYKHEQEQIVRSSESWYAIAFQSITDAVIATDVNGYIVFMNAAAESTTGWQLTDQWH
ncbi:MAG: response regulator [Cyanobacteria bacterium J06634_6]